MANGCSGLLLWRPDGRASGAITAEHCGLYPEHEPRVTGSDGRSYLVRTDPFVRAGSEIGSSRALGKVTRAVLSPPGAQTDLALFVFEGHTVEEVLADYDRDLISGRGLGTLPRGANVQLAGFPDLQPRNPGPERLQTWDAGFIGPVTIKTTPYGITRFVRTLMLSVRPNGDGALCSPGASGGGAVVSFDEGGEVVTRHLGVLSGSDDFRDRENIYTPLNPFYVGPAVRVERERDYGMAPGALSDVDVSCDMAIERPGVDRVVVEIVDDPARIPR